MLVLTRKRSETIRIGEGVFIKVIRTGKSTVKIGIEAPSNVRVVRGELMALPHLDETQLSMDAGPMSDGLVDAGSEEDELIAACSDQFPQTPMA